MRVQAPREALLEPLQRVIGVVERRHTMAILANVLLRAGEEGVNFTATDLEVELSAWTALPVDEPGAITLPARKLAEILRAFPEGQTVTIVVDGDRGRIACGRSRFTLVTLPAEEYPLAEDLPFDGELEIVQGDLQRILARSHFAMAEQDVRHYLNGLLLELAEGRLCAVATDGHRLSRAETAIESGDAFRLIAPNKACQGLMRLLGEGEENARVRFGANHLQVELGTLRMTTKLVDATYPEYERVIPRQADHVVVLDRAALHGALVRAAILSGDRNHGVRLMLESWKLRVESYSSDQEESNEELEVSYDGDPFQLAYNARYLQDAVSAQSSELVRLSFTAANGGCVVEDPDDESTLHVVMPMRL